MTHLIGPIPEGVRPLNREEVESFRNALKESIARNFGMMFKNVWANPCFPGCELWDVGLIYKDCFSLTYEESRVERRDFMALRVSNVIRGNEIEGVHVAHVKKDGGVFGRSLHFLIAVVSERD